MCVAGAMAHGESSIEETVFENRFCYAEELKKYKINIKITDRIIKINKSNLINADTYACDLRGGAALCIAALCAEGKSRIYNIEHIDRGYEHFDKIVRSLGGKITREDEEEKSVEGIGRENCKYP
jgi:UDP-N-acetylglucosamine 1-carboxyvinyltransferase